MKIFWVATVVMLLMVSTYNSDATTTVHVTNDLGPGKNLFIHCKSADDDLGRHDLHNLLLQFSTQFLRDTEFYCFFEWDSESHWFNIYIYERDRFLCSEGVNGICRCMVKAHGPCL
ncbi:Plant self-incompatibility protein S1 family [Euphorbia peplus]|nr:Plant self-incompatibility protein S1 family [Euphorbia peplus]